MNLTKLEELLNKDIGTLKEVETTLETAKYNFSLRRITQYLGEFLENISDVDLQNTYPRLKATARFEKHTVQSHKYFLWSYDLPIKIPTMK